MSTIIFLSAVSKEFHLRDNSGNFASYRDVLANALRRLGPNYSVVVQEDLAQGFGDLLETLDSEVRRSDVVVHLIGNLSGCTCTEASVRRLRERYPSLLHNEPELAATLNDALYVTYTQWEIYLAFEHGSRRLVFVADPEAPRSPQCQTNEMEQSQILHMARLKTTGEHRERFADQRDLALKVVTSIVRFGVGSEAAAEEVSPDAVEAARADAAGLVHAIAQRLAGLLRDTNRLAEAEPLMRRALAIDEQFYGAEHPKVAIRLNNLAGLLQATNRLAEAEPLSRRMVQIFFLFGRNTGHENPHLQLALRNHLVILQALETPANEIAQRLQSLASVEGPLPSILPEVESLLGPATPVDEVLKCLDATYRQAGKSAVWFLPLGEPISPHLDDLLGPVEAPPATNSSDQQTDPPAADEGSRA